MIDSPMLQIDSQLENVQRKELVERMLETLATDSQAGDIDDKVWSVCNGFIPVYHYQLVREWNDANYPRPDEYGLEPLLTADPFEIMRAGLINAAQDYLQQLFNAYHVDVYSTSDAVTEEAINACRDVLTNYGVKPQH